MYSPRTLEAYLKKADRQVPVLLVTGARQVGKTTLLRHASTRRRSYVTLDDPLVLRLAREDPNSLFHLIPCIVRAPRSNPGCVISSCICP